MYDLVSIQRIERQIEDLNIQEKDALQALEQNTSIPVQVFGLLARIRKDREHLQAVLRDSVETGRAGVRWSELVAEHRRDIDSASLADGLRQLTAAQNGV